MARRGYSDDILSAIPAWPETVQPKEIADSLSIKANTVQGTLRRFHDDSDLDVWAVERGVYSRSIPTDDLRRLGLLGEKDGATVDVDRVIYRANGGRQSDEADVDLDVVTYSAGRGSHAVERILRSRVEVETSTGYKAEALIPIYVEGDSMWPYILPNSLAWALPMERFAGNGVYAFDLDGHKLVKQVDVLLGGVLRVSARNRDAYPDAEELEPLPDADTPNTYRSRTTGMIGEVVLTGRLVAFTQVT